MLKASVSQVSFNQTNQKNLLNKVCFYRLSTLFEGSSPSTQLASSAKSKERLFYNSNNNSRVGANSSRLHNSSSNVFIPLYLLHSNMCSPCL